MDIRLEAFEANQVVNFVTWTLTVDGNVRESILDHVYTTNPLSILNLNHNWLAFTDHGLIMFQISSKKSEPEHSIRRDWCNYSKEKLGQALARHDWDFTSDSVQAYWGQLENQLVTIVDELVPLVTQTNIEAPLPAFMKQKLNHRKSLLKSNRNNTTTEKIEQIKKLNHDGPNHDQSIHSMRNYCDKFHKKC